MGMEIGAVLLTIRKKKRIRQGSVCHGNCGISTYSQYENGERVPDILSLRMLFGQFLRLYAQRAERVCIGGQFKVLAVEKGLECAAYP